MKPDLKSQNKQQNGRTSSAIHVTASALGILTGIPGISHGIFEVLQGNMAPDSITISAIIPEHRFWEYGFETAMIIIPNFFHHRYFNHNKRITDYRLAPVVAISGSPNKIIEIVVAERYFNPQLNVVCPITCGTMAMATKST